MAKTLKLPINEVGYIQISEIIILAEGTALMLYTWENADCQQTRGWSYFNPETGELIGVDDGQ